MGIFSLIKKVGNSNHLMRKDQQLLENSLPVHPDIKDLLWIENGPYKNWKGNQNITQYEVMGLRFKITYGSDEPSLISLNEPIDTSYSEAVPNPGYYPSYKGLSPQQKGVYWHFLENPFAGGFDISYVFILYYGLERHLYEGDYEKAVDVILRLRQVYDNASFQSYSWNAIAFTRLIRQRSDFATRLYNERSYESDSSISPDMLLFCKLGLMEPLSAKDLMVLARPFGFTNTNYIKKYPELFEKALEEKMNDTPLYLPDYLTEYEFRTLEKGGATVFANYSMDVRWIDIPAIAKHVPLAEKVRSLLGQAHNQVKEDLKKRRKEGTQI